MLAVNFCVCCATWDMVFASVCCAEFVGAGRMCDPCEALFFMLTSFHSVLRPKLARDAPCSPACLVHSAFRCTPSCFNRCPPSRHTLSPPFCVYSCSLEMLEQRECTGCHATSDPQCSDTNHFNLTLYVNDMTAEAPNKRSHRTTMETYIHRAVQRCGCFCRWWAVVMGCCDDGLL